MLGTQNYRVFKELVRGPVNQFWGVDQYGKRRILDLPRRICDLKEMGCAIEKHKQGKLNYYSMTYWPVGIETNLQPIYKGDADRISDRCAPDSDRHIQPSLF